MTRTEIKIKYDAFFGTGLWERDYKPHITVFAEQCVRESESAMHWIACEDNLPEIGSRILAKTAVGETYYGVYSAYNEFDLHRPTSDGYREQWLKSSTQTVLQWRYL